jgi:outer membrane murein-binding lipoprotein Lpp
VEDALAVMSVERHHSVATHSYLPTVRWVVAASICGIALLTGIAHIRQMPETTCYAYIAGQYVDNRAQLDQLMSSQISELAEQMEQSQAEMDSQVSELSAMMQEYEQE